MSTGPIERVSCPAIPMPDPPKRKRTWPRRIARGIGFTVGGLVGLVLALLVFLQTPWGKSFVRGRVEAKLAGMVNGQVRLASVDYSFLFGELDLHGLEIRDASGAPAIALGSLHVELDRLSLVKKAPVIEQLALAGVDVNVVKRADGTSNLKGLFKPRKQTKPLASIKVLRLSVAGKATITKPDGSVISIADLALAGDVAARPAIKEVDLALRGLGAHVTISKPGAPAREIAVSIESVKLGKRQGAIDADVGKLTAGAVSLESLAAHVKLDGKRLAGDQAIELAGLRIDDQRLAALLGRELLTDDVAIDVSIKGPAAKLAVDGDVRAGATHLALTGSLDASDLKRPHYSMALDGEGLRSDLVKRPGKPRPVVQTSLRVELTGAGIARRDMDSKLVVAVGKTTIGKLAVDALDLTATAKHGTMTLESLTASLPGLAIAATGSLAADKAVAATITLKGEPAKLIATLEAAGKTIKLKAPARAALPSSLELALDARGQLDGIVAVQLAPTTVKLAGGRIELAGHAQLANKKLQQATADITLARLDLAALARLAGKQPKLGGTLSGTIELARTPTAKQAAFDLDVALATLGLAVNATGIAEPTGVVSHVTATQAKDRSVVATVDATLPLAKRAGKTGLDPSGSLRVKLDIARRSFAQIADLLPPRLRAKLPTAGAAEVHVALAGSPARPTGTIDINLTAVKVKHQQQRVTLHGDIASSDSGLAIASTGSIWIKDEATPIARLAATVSTALPGATGKLDAADVRAMRKAATVDATIDIPQRDLASLAFVKPLLAKLGGTLDGHIKVTGPLALPQLAAELRIDELRTAADTRVATTIVATGTPRALRVAIDHARGLAPDHSLARGAVRLDASIDRSVAGKLDVKFTARAAKAPLLGVLPAFLAPKLGKVQPGSLDWHMDGTVALAKNAAGKLALSGAAVTGTLDVTGGALALPNSNRRWDNIELAIASEPTGLRIKTLSLHESDRAVANRTLTASGFVSLDQMKAKKVSLALAANKWLLSGTPALGLHDAPRATADFDIGVEVDLGQPVIAVDATVNHLALHNAERFDRGLYPDTNSFGGDVIFVDGKQRAGKLPVAKPVIAVATAPRKVRAMDIRVHIPNAIHVDNAPLDVMAKGDITIAVRQDGRKTRGTLTFESGTINVFGKRYKLVTGGITFSEAHPKGQLEATFEHALPPAVMRELSLASAGGGATMSLSGPIAQPKKALGGASNAGLAEAMAINATGHTVYVSGPDLPASATVTTSRVDGLSVLSFMAGNLPHLMFLDRVTAWADPYRGSASYGRIENAEAERYTKNQRTRVRAVVRPRTPGRSTTEVQVDRMLINTDRTAVGVGVRAGDRAGGGVGVFVEWSSD